MRKIISKQEADRRKRINQFIVGGILIAVLFLSVMGFAFQNNSLSGTSGNSTQTVSYNGISFVNQNGFWVLQSSNNELAFTYNPNEIAANIIGLADLGKTISDYNGKVLYIYYNSSNIEESNAESEIYFNMKNFASSIIPKPINESLNANCLENSIILQNGTLGVKQSGSCVYISGQGEDLINLVDGVLFKLLGIIK